MNPANPSPATVAPHVGDFRMAPARALLRSHRVQPREFAYAMPGAMVTAEPEMVLHLRESDRAIARALEMNDE